MVKYIAGEIKRVGFAQLCEDVDTGQLYPYPGPLNVTCRVESLRRNGVAEEDS